MTVAVRCVRCPDGVVRWPLASCSDGQETRALTRISNIRGTCADGCPGGKHELAEYGSPKAFRDQQAMFHPHAPEPETDERMLLPKRMPKRP